MIWRVSATSCRQCARCSSVACLSTARCFRSPLFTTKYQAIATLSTEELELDEDPRAEVDRELRRLERTSPQSAEYQVIRTFLEWIIELPWQERTEEKIDLGLAEEILEEDHYGLEDVKDRILEFLAVRIEG